MAASDLAQTVQRTRAELSERGRTALIQQGCPVDLIRFEATALLRFAGADTHLVVDLPDTRDGHSVTVADNLRASFAEVHRARFGFAPGDTGIVLKEITVEAIGRLHAESSSGSNMARFVPKESDPGIGQSRLFAGGTWHACKVYPRARIEVDARITGPCIISGKTETIVVDPGWSATCTRDGSLILERQTQAIPPATPDQPSDAHEPDPDPVLLEVYFNAFQSIAEEMGLVLQSTATSVNIKERLDFSCALFDPTGGLIASAPHIPVHLGSMSDSVRAVREKWRGAMAPGDVFVTNNPYAGGTHLPDVTVITPFYIEENDQNAAPDFFLASRGHHADIGGITPGSMPASSTHIDQEGILIDNLRLIQNGRLRENELRAVLGGGDFPARNPDQNLADLGAQIAANHRGTRLLLALIAERGAEKVRSYVRFIQSNAEQAVRTLARDLPGGSAEVPLDDGGRIRVSITRQPNETHPLRVDFTGSSTMSSGNGNAPSAVVRSAVLYVLRTLVGDHIPLNEGCLAPVELILPESSLLRPAYPAAVVGGNVETSQNIVDALLIALDALAASQGTMNNLTFGNDRYQYYETICGGTGAGPGFAGASGVHAHMTNSRLTDPEVLETRFPVLVRAFGLRANSGGRGNHRGGDGVFRLLCFREDMRVSLLSSRRLVASPGLADGGEGAPGRNWIRRAADAADRTGDFHAWSQPDAHGFTPLSFRDEFDVSNGDEILIETPGGGGYGS